MERTTFEERVSVTTFMALTSSAVIGIATAPPPPLAEPANGVCDLHNLSLSYSVHSSSVHNGDTMYTIPSI